jgi:hypothetical protein
MQIQARAVGEKGHTKGFKIGGRWHTRQQAVRLAENGKLNDVIVRRSPSGKYITATPDTRRLADLPETHVRDIRGNVFGR